LPQPSAVRCYTSITTFTSSLPDCAQGEVHGTAVAETLSDVAPEVSIYLGVPRSWGNLLDIVSWMVSQGVQVINHSAGWIWAGPGDGTTVFSDSPLAAVNLAVANGIVWVNAAGNEAKRTWTGPFVDDLDLGLMSFAPADPFNGLTLVQGSPVVIQLRWNDSWSNASRDLDLFLTDAAGEIVAGSASDQSGQIGHIPLELFQFVPTSTGVFFLAVEHYAGSIPSWVDLQVFGGVSSDLEYSTPSNSMANPAESANPGLLAVGAVPHTSSTTIESFSSRGPTRDGRVKPDVVGADRGATVSYGAEFPGTSQASPHVAGVAALVRQRFPTMSAIEVANYIRGTASPVGSPVPNNTFGHGLTALEDLPGAISLDPAAIEQTLLMPPSEPSSSSTAVVISSVGEGALNMTAIAEADGNQNITDLPWLSLSNLPGFPLTVAPGDEQTFTATLDCAGQTEGVLDGHIRVTSDDPDQPFAWIEVGLNCVKAPAIQLDPVAVGHVLSLPPGGQSASSTSVTISSAGSADLQVTGIVEADVDLVEADVAWLTLSGLPQLPLTLEPGNSASFTIAVDCTDLDAGVHKAEVQVASNDLDQPSASMEVTLQCENVPDVEVAPVAISQVLQLPPGNPSSGDSTVTITNVGISDLEVTGATGAMADQIEADVSWLTLSGLPSLPLILAEGESASLTVSVACADLASGTHEALIQIASNDPDESLVEVPVVLVCNEPDDAVLTGTILLEGRSSYGGVTVTDGTSSTVTTSTGEFSLSVPPGSVELIASAPRFLSASIQVNAQSGGTQSIPVATLLVGDLNQDQQVDLLDMLAVARVLGGIGSDLTGDGRFDVRDLVIIARNFGKTESPWGTSD